VKALLAQGANPNVVDKRRRAPLHFAAEKGCFDAIKVLAA